MNSEHLCNITNINILQKQGVQKCSFTLSTPPRGVKLITLIVSYLHPLHGIHYLQALKLPLCLPADSHRNGLSWLTLIHPLWRREPLFYKRGKSDIFCSKKFAMSLFRAIFAFGNGRKVANLGFVFTECLHSAFALGSLCLHSGFASRGEEKHKAMRQQRQGTNKRSLTYLLIGFFSRPSGWNLYMSSGLLC